MPPSNPPAPGRHARAGQAPRRRAVAVLAVVLVVALGATGTALASYAPNRTVADRAARTLADRTTIVANAVSAEIARYRAGPGPVT